MTNNPGAYALIMSLEKDQTIEVGKLGTFDFPAGWYAYAGSAQGGVRTRTKAHLRDDKKSRFNVDYLRAYAPVSEIWYSFGPRWLECIYAQTLLFQMPCASFVAKEFGSRDCKECYTHLLYFDKRPFPTAFRSALRESHDPVEVLVEFTAPFPAERVMLNDQERASLLSSYDRGRRWVEHQRAKMHDREATCSSPEFAELLGVPVGTLADDVRLAEAVEVIVTNCGGHALDVLFCPDHPMERRQIQELSMHSALQQRERIGPPKNRFDIRKYRGPRFD